MSTIADLPETPQIQLLQTRPASDCVPRCPKHEIWEGPRPLPFCPLALASTLLHSVASALVAGLSLLEVFLLSPRPSWTAGSPSSPLQPDLPTAVTVTFSKIQNLILLLPFAYRVKELAPASLPCLSPAILSSFSETSEFYLTAHRTKFTELLTLCSGCCFPLLNVYSSLKIRPTSLFSTDPSA